MSSDISPSKNAGASTAAGAPPSTPKPTYAQVVNGSSPAAQRLAAVNDRDGKKSKTSRLRRAFSFGSAAELRRASAENSAINNAAAAAAAAATATEQSRVGQETIEQEREVEQARIAEQQEAAGIGAGIYNGQGRFFTGSTDNLSISSTASSASVMIRKMGKGMKKSTRSLVGLFRPKSIVGVPAADGSALDVGQAQVSLVNVEADRERGKLSDPLGDIDFHSAPISLTGDRSGSTSTENSASRRSIVGTERDRAEVLAAVKKGILKRSCPVDDDPDFTNISQVRVPTQAHPPQSSNLLIPRRPTSICPISLTSMTHHNRLHQALPVKMRTVTVALGL